MIAARRQSPEMAGLSLVETIVSVGVLAVVIPLALAAMLKAGVTGASARAETRAPAIADYCMLELRAARNGASGLLDSIQPGENFGGSGSFMGLGFGRDGSVIGKVSQAEYENGVTEIGDDQVYFLSRLSGDLETTDLGLKLVTVTVVVEYPASKDGESRTRTSFHTKLP